MLDFDKELPPSAVQKEELLLQVARDHFITGLNEEVTGVVHLHVLLHPVREVSEENLKGRTTNEAHRFKRVLILVAGTFSVAGSHACDCPYTLGILRLTEHPFSILEPGLESGHAAGVLLPVGDDLLQHAADTAHLQGQVLPLRCGVAEEFTNALRFVNWKRNTNRVQLKRRTIMFRDRTAIRLMLQDVRK